MVLSLQLFLTGGPASPKVIRSPSFNIESAETYNSLSAQCDLQSNVWILIKSSFHQIGWNLSFGDLGSRFWQLTHLLHFLQEFLIGCCFRKRIWCCLKEGCPRIWVLSSTHWVRSNNTHTHTHTHINTRRVNVTFEGYHVPPNWAEQWRQANT